MIQSFKIHINPNTYQPDSDFGEIYIEADGLYFPSQHWTDFGKVIAFWWLNAIHSITRGEEEVIFSFMDGPYRFSVHKNDEETFNLELYEDRLEKQVILRDIVSKVMLFGGVTDCCEVMLRFCQNTISTPKREYIEKLINEIKLAMIN